MKKESLLKSLEMVNWAFPVSKNILSSLTCYVPSSSGGGYIRRSDFEGFYIETPIDIEHDSWFVFNSEIAANWVKTLSSEEDIVANIKDEKIILQQGKSKTNLKIHASQSNDDFVFEPPVISGAKGCIKINSEDLLEAMRMLYSGSKLENGFVLFSQDEKRFDFVSGNSYTIKRYQFPVYESSVEPFKIRLPYESRKRMAEFANRISGEIAVSLYDNHIVLESQGTRMILASEDLPIPDYERVLSSESHITIKTSKKKLEEMLRTLAVATDDQNKTNIIFIGMASDDSLIAKAQNDVVNTQVILNEFTVLERKVVLPITATINGNLMKNVAVSDSEYVLIKITDSTTARNPFVMTVSENGGKKLETMIGQMRVG